MLGPEQPWLDADGDMLDQPKLRYKHRYPLPPPGEAAAALGDFPEASGAEGQGSDRPRKGERGALPGEILHLTSGALGERGCGYEEAVVPAGGPERLPAPILGDQVQVRLLGELQNPRLADGAARHLGGELGDLLLPPRRQREQDLGVEGGEPRR